VGLPVQSGRDRFEPVRRYPVVDRAAFAGRKALGFIAAGDKIRSSIVRVAVGPFSRLGCSWERFSVEGYRRARVLFVCLGNSCRSPMAEAVAAHIASDVMEVSSAGVAALGRVQSLTKLTVAKNGYPADGLQSKSLEDSDLEAADIVINMTGRPGLALFPDGSKLEDWDVEDPYGSDGETYQRVFEDIESRVVELVGRVRRSGTSEFTARNAREKRAGQQ
jgi:protein-tyrosine-phosphatase